MEVLGFTRRNSRFKHGSVIVHNLFAYFTSSLCTSQIYMIKEKCWFSQMNFFEHFPQRINVLFPADLMSSTNTDKNNPLDGVRINILNLEFSPSHVSIRFSQIVCPIIVLPKDDHTDFAHEERLGLPCWTMISAICVGVDESKCLDIPILESSTIWAHLPFFTWVNQILRLLLVRRNLAIWRWYPWLLLLSFEMLMILVRCILHKTTNRLLQHHLGVQLDLCISDALPPIQHFSNAMSISVSEATCFIVHFFLTSDFRQVPRRNFLQFFPFLVHWCVRCRNFTVWGIGIKLWTKL